MGKLVVPKFIDHHPSYTASGFACTNEEPELFNELLGDKKFGRVACIASGGEFLLSVLLHRAEEIIAVDHSYRSLFAAYSKLLLLQQVPYGQVRSMLRNAVYTALRNHLVPLWEHIPEPIRNHSTNKYQLSDHDLQQIRREWCADSIFRKVSGAAARRVTFVHGDLRDVKALFGTFDLFYASNAAEHIGRDYKSPTFNEFADLLNPGGLLLYTRQYGPMNSIAFKEINHIAPIRSSWNHCLAQKV